MSNYDERVKTRMQGFQSKIVNTLKEQGPLTRGQLVQILDVPRTTIFDHLKKLKEIEMVKTYTRPKKSRGRPSVFYKLVE